MSKVLRKISTHLLHREDLCAALRHDNVADLFPSDSLSHQRAQVIPMRQLFARRRSNTNVKQRDRAVIRIFSEIFQKVCVLCLRRKPRIVRQEQHLSALRFRIAAEQVYVFFGMYAQESDQRALLLQAQKIAAHHGIII